MLVDNLGVPDSVSGEAFDHNELSGEDALEG